MKYTALFVLSLLLLVPFQSQALSLDSVVKSYIESLKTRIVALEKENNELRDEIRTLKSVSVSSCAKKFTKYVQPKIDAVNAFNDDTDRLIENALKNPFTGREDASRIVTERNKTFFTLSKVRDVALTKWNVECR